MEPIGKAASIIMAAGRGSRMKGYDGAKTLLPLVAGDTPYSGSMPILLHIIENLPPGPKAVVVNHRKEDIIAATHHLDVTYLEQPVLNGTGGALLAARPFLEQEGYENLVITMGDVPFVKPGTYGSLLESLDHHPLMILGFKPQNKKQYGVLEIHGDRVRRIIEWKYWRDYPKQRQDSLSICNSGIYAAKRENLLESLSVLASKPHLVRKEINGVIRHQEEFFITDLVEYLPLNHSVGYIVSGNEDEVMGIDDFSALLSAQEIYGQGT